MASRVEELAKGKHSLRAAQLFVTLRSCSGFIPLVGDSLSSRRALTWIRRVVLPPRARQGGPRWTNASTGVCGTLGHILLTLPSTLEGKKSCIFPSQHNSRSTATLTQPLCQAQSARAEESPFPRGAFSWQTQPCRDEHPQHKGTDKVYF